MLVVLAVNYSQGEAARLVGLINLIDLMVRDGTVLMAYPGEVLSVVAVVVVVGMPALHQTSSTEVVLVTILELS